MTADPSMVSVSLGERLAAGDETSVREIYDRWGRAVYTYCRRRLPDHVAQEAMQDVFVDAWRRRATFDPERGSLPAWLMGIARHRVIDRARSESRHADRRSAQDVGDDISVHPVAAEPSADDAVTDRILVADALAGLPDRMRDVIRLAYFRRLTHVEIAERTGIPLGTVKSDIARGLERIRRTLEGSDD